MAIRVKKKLAKKVYSPVRVQQEIPLCEQPLSNTETFLLELLNDRQETCIVTSDELIAARKLKKRQMAGLYQSTLTKLWWLVLPKSS